MYGIAIYFKIAQYFCLLNGFANCSFSNIFFRSFLQHKVILNKYIKTKDKYHQMNRIAPFKMIKEPV